AAHRAPAAHRQGAPGRRRTPGPPTRRGAGHGAVRRGRPLSRPAHPRRAMSGAALDLAAAVRSGSRSAREAVDEHLAAVDEREAELHACNLVTADAARDAADAVDAAVARGDDPGPLAGVPIVLKDN